MMPSKSSMRKRSRDVMEQQEGALPLQNVVACLSGYAHETKNELHQLIESLGGRYTRELNLDKNTHLITEVAQGAKFDLAAANPQTIRVVTSSWLHAAAESEEPPLESDHQISMQSQTRPSLQRHHSAASLLPAGPDLSTRLNQALKNDNPSTTGNRQPPRYSLFQHHQFYLLGFENRTEWKQKLGKLIRRGGGTIYWELNEDVTVLVLCDGCDSALYKAAQIVSQHHPNLPPSVSPLWVIESYQKGFLEPPRLFPPVRSILPVGVDTTKTNKISTSASASTASKTTVFRGCLFSFLRTSVDERSSKEQVLEFDPNEQAAFVKAHGGQLLSNKLVDALRADVQKSAATATTESSSKRKCYVVCWGGGNPRVDTSPLVSQLQRDNLADIVLVTPFWVQTCVTVRKRVRPERVPLILMPQSWSVKSLISKAEKSKKEGYQQRRLDISLTGFQGTEKAAIIHLIGAVGGLYHDHMSSTNTHLICKDAATGIKLEKALQWGLHIVSIEWLYHVLEHGYAGAENEVNGCEERFSVAEKKK